MVTVLAGQIIPPSAQQVRDDLGRTWSLGADGMWHDDATGRHHRTGAELSASTDLTVLGLGDPVELGVRA